MIFVMPLIMIGMMITGYLGTMHSPQPNGMPIVVSGSATLADAIAEAQPDGLDVEVAASAYDARQRVVTRDATAAIVVDGDTATLYTASAGGARTGSTLSSPMRASGSRRTMSHRCPRTTPPEWAPCSSPRRS
jgi:hypothetical protein